MRALIQSKAGRPYNISATIAAHGFLQRGYQLIPFTVQEIDSTIFLRQDVVVGGVGTYRRVFEKLGVTWEGRSYPPSLYGFLGREIGLGLLKELGPRMESRPLFIKPAQDNKLFTGFVCKDRWDMRLSGVADDAAIIWADVVNFKSEYRVYVLDTKIQNISRYHGGVGEFPSARIIREMIDSYESAPISYGLDVGVNDKGETLLVEVNEGLALGNYGLAPCLHAKMIAARWHQIMGDSTKANEEAQTTDSPAYVNEI